jgi:hypothetical protein
MTLLEATFEEVMLHLRQAQAAMRRFMAASGDQTAKIQAEVEFRELHRTCRAFARHQYGIGVPAPRSGDESAG